MVKKYKDLRQKSKQVLEKFDQVLLARHEAGATLDELALLYGFVSRQSVYYHIKQARKRANKAKGR